MGHMEPKFWIINPLSSVVDLFRGITLTQFKCAIKARTACMCAVFAGVVVATVVFFNIH